MASIYHTNELNWPPSDLDSIHEDFKCPKCQQIMVNAHQADDCGCRFCLTCLDEMTKTDKKVCLKCNSPITDFKIPDMFHQKRVSNLKVSCIHCNWNGTLFDYRKHFNEHLKPTPCKYCNIQLNTQKDYEKHIKEGECPKQPVECIYKQIGCCLDDKLINEQYYMHIKQNFQYHLELLYKYIKSKFKTIEEALNDLKIRDTELMDSSTSENSIKADWSNSTSFNTKRLKESYSNDSGFQSTASLISPHQQSLFAPKKSLNMKQVDDSRFVHDNTASNQVSLLGLKKNSNPNILGSLGAFNIQEINIPKASINMKQVDDSRFVHDRSNSTGINTMSIKEGYIYEEIKQIKTRLEKLENELKNKN